MWDFLVSITSSIAYGKFMHCMLSKLFIGGCSCTRFYLYFWDHTRLLNVWDFLVGITSNIAYGKFMHCILSKLFIGERSYSIFYLRCFWVILVYVNRWEFLVGID